MSQGSKITWGVSLKKMERFLNSSNGCSYPNVFFSTRAILHGLHHFVQSIILWPTEPSHIGPCFSWSQEWSNGWLRVEREIRVQFPAPAVISDSCSVPFILACTCTLERITLSVLKTKTT